MVWGEAHLNIGRNIHNEAAKGASHRNVFRVIKSYLHNTFQYYAPWVTRLPSFLQLLKVICNCLSYHLSYSNN